MQPSMLSSFSKQSSKFFSAFMVAGLLAGAASATPIEGSSSGIFIAPLPATGTYSGIGTNDLKWGSTVGVKSNEVIFNGGVISSELDTSFKIGTFNYTNGAATAGTSAESFKLSLDILFTSPALGLQTFVFDFLVTATTNTSDPDASADYLTLPSALPVSSFLIGADLYTLRILGFDNVVGDGFLASSSTELHVREELSASADLVGRIERDTRDVPEPGSLLLVGLALGVLGLRRKFA